MPIFDIDGQKIHAVQQGNPKRQTCILIHGWSSSWYALKPLVSLLAQRFNCLAIDLPGYGESPPLDKRVTISDYADVLAKLIEQVSDGPVVLVGHSMGGMASATLALRYPVLVERMVLICPTISGNLSNTINLAYSIPTFFEKIGLERLVVALMGTGLIENLVIRITDYLMRPVSFSARTGIPEDEYQRVRADARRKGQGRTRAECYFAMRENNLTGRLSKIEPPALVLWGAEDNTVPLRDSGVVADEWHTADLRIIPKAGHWPQFETPDITRRYIAAFLGLPFLTSETTQAADDDLAVTQEVGQFLANSDVGNSLNQAQRIRLAAQFHQKVFKPGETIVKVEDPGTEMYIVQNGTVEVWTDPDATPGQPSKNLRYVASLTPGQITGELAMLDGGLRSADLRAGPEGATVLNLDRDRLLALCEDDSSLGTRVLFNIARAMALRQRFILWQLQRAQKASKAAAAPPTGKSAPVTSAETSSEFQSDYQAATVE
jgi:pimeloyl-ACP methyl ester carboxylesterase/CRP-like cAMP-binding protein